MTCKVNVYESHWSTEIIHLLIVAHTHTDTDKYIHCGWRVAKVTPKVIQTVNIINANGEI